MRSAAVRAALTAGAFAVAVRGLTWLTPAPAEAAAALRHPQAAAEGVGLDALALAAAGAACWLAMLWLALALLMSAMAGRPGRCGRFAERVVQATVPVTARRLIALTLGLSVVTATGGPPAMATIAPHHRPPTSTLDLDWPLAGERAAAPPAQTARKPSSPAPADGRSDGIAAVLVRPGDSLWTIARQHLPADAGTARIAVAWPRWYAANRAVVGADPDLLLPGQRLVPPADSSEGNP